MKKELLPRRDSTAEKAPDIHVRGFQFFLCEAAYETTANCVPISMFSSLIQTILSVPESPHMRVTGSAAHHAGRGLYRRLGLAPDPEDLIPFTLSNITL